MRRIIDFTKIKTIPIKQRKNKVSIEDLADIESEIWIWPLSNRNLKKLSKKIIQSYNEYKEVILMMGAHVIKVEKFKVGS